MLSSVSRLNMFYWYLGPNLMNPRAQFVPLVWALLCSAVECEKDFLIYVLSCSFLNKSKLVWKMWKLHEGSKESIPKALSLKDLNIILLCFNVHILIWMRCRYLLFQFCDLELWCKYICNWVWFRLWMGWPLLVTINQTDPCNTQPDWTKNVW